MTDPTSTKYDESHSATLQHLAELDSLLEQMLSLPVNQTQENQEFNFQDADLILEGERSTGRNLLNPAETEEEALTPFSSLALEEPPPTQDISSSIETEVSFTESESPETPAPDALRLSHLELHTGIDTPPKGPAHAREFTPATSIQPWQPPANFPKVNKKPVPLPLWMHVLVAVNRVFDFIVCRGPFRWLSSPFGRTVLGWTGILLLVGASLWVVLDWMKWGG